MDKPITYFVFGSQCLGAVSIFLAIVFYVVFGGGLDLMGYEIPGLSGTCIVLPIVFPLSVFFYLIDPKLRNQTIADLLWISVVILSGVLAIQAVRVMIELASWFI